MPSKAGEIKEAEMKSRGVQFFLLGSMLSWSVFAASADARLQQTEVQQSAALNGVAVRSIWDVANFFNKSWLADEPTFVAEQKDFVFRTSFDAQRPETGEPIGIDVTWTISDLSEKHTLMEKYFKLPEGSKYLVTAGFEYPALRKYVETLTIVLDRDGKLIGLPLGYKKPDGDVVADPSIANDRVFEMLGTQMYTRRLTIVPALTEEP